MAKRSKKVSKKTLKTTAKRPVGRPRKSVATGATKARKATKAPKKVGKKVGKKVAKRTYTRRKSATSPFSPAELETAQQYARTCRSEIRTSVAATMRQTPTESWTRETVIYDGTTHRLNTYALAEALGVEWN